MNRFVKTLILVLATLLIGYVASSTIYLLRFPSEIKMTENATHNLNFGLPLWGFFEGETASVAKINSQPITEDFGFRLNTPVTVSTGTEGSAELALGLPGLPIRRIVLDVVPDIKLIPLGTAIGVRINTDGVMVLGTGSFLGTDGETHRPADNILKSGDLITEINGIQMKNKEMLSELIANSTGDIVISLTRDGQEMTVKVTPQINITDNVRRIGVWVRDSTKGIGTLTYFDPASDTFGALGHGIIDVDTKKLMSVRDGTIMPSNVTSVQRGERGSPGELEGEVNTSETLGLITSNTPIGVYGTLTRRARDKIADQQPIPIALRSHITEGPATILTTVSDNETREVDIVIESVNRNTSDETKGMVIRVTDKEFLKITGGIVQGMSGSPIIQNGRLAGAVTHVFVQDPTRGYGIFIESMLGLQ